VTESLLAALTALQFQFAPIHQYKISNRAVSRNGGVQVFTLSAAAGAANVKTTIFEFESEALAENAKKDQINRMRAVYDDHPEQYFAMVTRKIQCPKKYQIESGTNGRLEWLRMYANNRDVLGACAPDIAVKRAQAVFLVCGKKLLKLVKFTPREDWNKSEEDELSSISCQN
jgi:hypothetical protein